MECRQQYHESNVENYISDLFNPVLIDDNVTHLLEPNHLVSVIKGGGQGAVETQVKFSRRFLFRCIVAAETTKKNLMFYDVFFLLFQPNSSFNFPVTGMMSPPPPQAMSGMLSSQPAMMNPTTALGATAIFGGVPVMPSVPAMNSTLPLYTLGGK